MSFDVYDVYVFVHFFVHFASHVSTLDNLDTCCRTLWHEYEARSTKFTNLALSLKLVNHCQIHNEFHIFHKFHVCFLNFSRSRYLKRPKQSDTSHPAWCWDILVNWHSLLVACHLWICLFSLFHVICMPCRGVNPAGHTSMPAYMCAYTPVSSCFSLSLCLLFLCYGKRGMSGPLTVFLVNICSLYMHVYTSLYIIVCLATYGLDSLCRSVRVHCTKAVKARAQSMQEGERPCRG